MSEIDTTETPVKKTRAKRSRAVAAPTLNEDQFSQLLAVLAAGQQKTGGGIDAETLAQALSAAAQVSADTMKRALRPENEHHPGISSFSRPKGDKAEPKIPPPFAFAYNGFPCTKFLETEHWREVELMHDVEPGEYTVIRTDGSKMAVKVVGERDANGALTKVDVQFPVQREERMLVPPKACVLYQIVHAGEKAPRQLFVEGLTEWLTLTLGEPVTA